MEADWKRRAFCRGMPVDFFYPSTDRDEYLAREVCGDCRVRLDCMNWAVVTGEVHGVWGGVGEKERKTLRRIWKSGDALRYEQAVAGETARIGTEISGYDIPEGVPEKLWSDERDCERCGGYIAEGFHVVDRNTQNATCGLPSTYNRGCRCEPCRQGKAKLLVEEKRKRKGSPRGDISELGSSGNPRPESTNDARNDPRANRSA